MVCKMMKSIGVFALLSVTQQLSTSQVRISSCGGDRKKKNSKQKEPSTDSVAKEATEKGATKTVKEATEKEATKTVKEAMEKEATEKGVSSARTSLVKKGLKTLKQ